MKKSALIFLATAFLSSCTEADIETFMAIYGTTETVAEAYYGEEDNSVDYSDYSDYRYRRPPPRHYRRPPPPRHMPPPRGHRTMLPRHRPMPPNHRPMLNQPRPDFKRPERPQRPEIKRPERPQFNRQRGEFKRAERANFPQRLERTDFPRPNGNRTIPQR